MRKYTDVDIVAALGAVVQLNTECYKGDFKHDIERFKAAAKHPDGENNRLLWLSRQNGTYCFKERDVYIKDTAPFNYWNGCATILGSQSPFPTIIVHDRLIAFAVNINGVENGRIKGDLYELDYRNYIRELNKAALPIHTVTAEYEDGTKITLPYREHDAQYNDFYHQHGKVLSYRTDPEDAGALREVLNAAREKREKEARPAAFKLRVQNPKPTIKQQIEAGKKQLAAKRAAAPQRTAGKNLNTGLED